MRIMYIMLNNIGELGISGEKGEYQGLGMSALSWPASMRKDGQVWCCSRVSDSQRIWQIVIVDII